MLTKTLLKEFARANSTCPDFVVPSLAGRVTVTVASPFPLSGVMSSTVSQKPDPLRYWMMLPSLSFSSVWIFFPFSSFLVFPFSSLTSIILGSVTTDHAPGALRLIVAVPPTFGTVILFFSTLKSEKAPFTGSSTVQLVARSAAPAAIEASIYLSFIFLSPY